jgi:chemotaxis protein methyltransferase WspC
VSREALLALLRDRIGLDAGALGPRIVDDACAEARRSLAVDDDVQLLRRMTLDPVAFNLAAEHFLVPESWFFRADEQFADLVRFAREQRHRRPLRILSLPCASGEEAYSAVIRLLEAGLLPGDIDVHGIDLSEPAVARARAGRYRTSALRGQALVEPWMQAVDGGFQVAETVRSCARFRIGNALDDARLRDDERFDAIFCRNLLIYLHDDARAALLDRLRDLLAEPGLLLAGHAEVVSSLHADFQPMPDFSPLSFRVRAREPAPPALPLADAAKDLSWLATASVRAAPLPSTPSFEPAAPPRNDAPRDVLAHASALADAGHLDEAHASCLRWLAGHPVDSQAWYLLGLIESAYGHHDAADEAFTRVLYLDRDHVDALAQRIGLAERGGRTAQARDRRARAARLRDRQAKSP